MSTTNAAATLDAAGACDVFASTRDNYERFAFLLIRAGHVPQLELAHLDFRVLLFLLGQKPGHYAAHHHTIAAACNSNTTSIRQSLARLRAAGVVLWELVPPHHRLPSGRFTRTNVNRYWVHLPRLATLLERRTCSPNSDASTLPNSDASYGTKILLEQKPPPQSPPRTAEEEAVSKLELGSELAPIREAWEKLGLGALDSRSMRTLENRIAEGATFEQLDAAVVGAGVDDWLRRRAKVPFAVVFASLASIERFAHEGRKRLDAQDRETRREAQERREEREERTRERERACNDRPPPAEDLRSWLPQTPPPAPPPRSLSAEEFAQRRVDQLARAEVWARENGLE